MKDEEVAEIVNARNVIHAKAAMLPEVTQSLTDCLRIIEGLDGLLAAYRLGRTSPPEKALALLENKTTIVAKAKEIAAKAREIGE